MHIVEFFEYISSSRTNSKRKYKSIYSPDSRLFLLCICSIRIRSRTRDIFKKLQMKKKSRKKSRYTCAKFQFDKRDYNHCIATLDEDICTSSRSQFLRLLAEFKYIIRNATKDMHDEITISRNGFKLLSRVLERVRMEDIETKNSLDSDL